MRSGSWPFCTKLPKSCSKGGRRKSLDEREFPPDIKADSSTRSLPFCAVVTVIGEGGREVPIKGPQTAEYFIF